MKKTLLILAVLSLMACGSTRPVIIHETNEVAIATYQIPEFHIPSKPVLPINSLRPEDKGNHNLIGKAYVKTVNMLDSFSDELLNILEGIKEKGEQ